MREVQVVAETEAPPERILEELSPTAIIEHADTFEIEETASDEVDDRLTVTGGEIEMTLEFDRTSDGYEFRQQGEDGPFEEMDTAVWVERGQPTRVVATSRFTFGGTLSFLTDRWAEKYRREELERLVSNLVTAVDPTVPEAADDVESSRSGDSDVVGGV